jgi:hypothetical protein
MKFKEYLTGAEPIKEDVDDIPTKAIDLIDDMLFALPENEQYGEKGEILRYILQCLQG